MTDLIERARLFASQAHAGMTIPDARSTPMLDHIAEVAELVSRHGGTQEMIAAAWLHDVVEDTDVTLEQIREQFGDVVHDLVDGLTDPVHFAPMPLEQRKQLQAERVATLDGAVRLVKLCDQTSNVRRIAEYPPDDWSLERQLIYANGAAAIARHCTGLAPELDAEFAEAFNAVAMKAGETPAD